VPGTGSFMELERSGDQWRVRAVQVAASIA
jgi:hypothetical protein